MLNGLSVALSNEITNAMHHCRDNIRLSDVKVMERGQARGRAARNSACEFAITQGHAHVAVFLAHMP